MRSLSLILTVLCITLSPLQVIGESGQCTDATSYVCPSLSSTCNETVYVSDCLDCQGYLSTDLDNNICIDRKLFNGDWWWRDLVGMIVWFISAGVATACGVGGGGIYVPLGILLLNFAPKPSSGLSQASIFGASVGGLLLNARNRHPFTIKVPKNKDEAPTSVPKKKGQVDTENETYYTRPLIDYDMALFLSPMSMGGAVLGVLIQTILPNWLYLTLASVIMGFTAYKTYGKFQDTHHKEVAAKEAALKESEESEDSSKAPLDKTVEMTAEIVNDVDSEVAPEPPAEPLHQQETTDDKGNEEKTSDNPREDSGMTEAEKLERRQYWLELDARQYPTEKIFALLILWCGVVLLTFLKGGKGVDSILNIDCTSPWYSVLIVAQFAWTIGISAIYGHRLMKQTTEKKACDYPWHAQDVIWDFEKIRFYAVCTFLAGIVAGLVGIGGGMILGPLMLVMGINPQVSSALNATMVVLTSSSVAILFVTAGLVPWEYAVTFFCVSFVGAYAGKKWIDGYVKKTGRASLLILGLAVIIALATIGCLGIVFMRLVAVNWCFAGFNKFCTASSDDPEGDLCPVDRMLSVATMPFKY